MNLSTNINHILNKYMIQLLSKQKILTVVDFIKEDTVKLSNITNSSLGEIITLKKNIQSQFGPTTANGLYYYNQLRENDLVIKTGIENFDKLLEGGLISGHLYEICGLSAVGKTQICNTIAVNLSLNQNIETLYIDAKNDFSGTRIFKMLQARNCSNTICGVTMEQIHCQLCYDVEEFMKILGALPTYLTEHDKCKCVIVDSLPALWFPLLEENSQDDEFMYLLTKAANLMRKIAVDHQIIFLLVNILTQWKSFELASEYQQVSTVALGKYWYSVPLQRFLLSVGDTVFEQSNNTEQNVIIQIMKGNQKGKTCNVKITNKGVVS